VSKMVRVGCLLILLTNGFIALALERRGTVTSGGYPMPGSTVVVARDQEKRTTHDFRLFMIYVHYFLD
jgi:hypothetical protein